jgi:hypothetical protein
VTQWAEPDRAQSRRVVPAEGGDMPDVLRSAWTRHLARTRIGV